MDEFLSFTNERFELISYVDDLCIVFNVSKHYDLKLIKVFYKYLEKNQ